MIFYWDEIRRIQFLYWVKGNGFELIFIFSYQHLWPGIEFIGIDNSLLKEDHYQSGELALKLGWDDDEIISTLPVGGACTEILPPPPLFARTEIRWSPHTAYLEFGDPPKKGYWNLVIPPTDLLVPPLP